MEANGPNASASAYITFERKSDSLQCIMCMDGFYLEDRMLRASFGTTKYCNYYLRGTDCTNPDCLYLHQIGEEQDCFTLEQMQNNKKYFREYTHPGPGPRPPFALEGPTKLPPPKPKEKKAEAAPRLTTNVSGEAPVAHGPKTWGAPGTGVAILKSAAVPPVQPKETAQPSTSSLVPTIVAPVAHIETVAPERLATITELKEDRKSTSPAPSQTTKIIEGPPAVAMSPPPGIHVDMLTAQTQFPAPLKPPQETSDAGKGPVGLVSPSNPIVEDPTAWMSSFDESKIDWLFSSTSNFLDRPNLVVQDPIAFLSNLLGLQITSNFSSRKQSRYPFAQANGEDIYIWSSQSNKPSIPNDSTAEVGDSVIDDTPKKHKGGKGGAPNKKGAPSTYNNVPPGANNKNPKKYKKIE
jgi:hypothetical protein